MRLKPQVQVQVQAWLCLSLALFHCCYSSPTTESERTSTVAAVRTTPGPVTAPSQSNGQDATAKPTPHQQSSQETDSSGISHIIKHTKLFTEFVSFAVDPFKTIDSVKSNLMVSQQLEDKNTTVVSKSAGESDDGLQQLFVEMMKRNSPGFVASIDYLNFTQKTDKGLESFRHPVRIWGIIPDEQANKSIYFLSTHFINKSKEAEIKSSIKEQVDDFENWKNETLSEFSDDKLSDGSIGSLVGG